MKNDSKSIEIYTILGHKILEAKHKQINVSGLPSGMYLIHIQASKNGISTKKCMKN